MIYRSKSISFYDNLANVLSLFPNDINNSVTPFLVTCWLELRPSIKNVFNAFEFPPITKPSSSLVTSSLILVIHYLKSKSKAWIILSVSSYTPNLMRISGSQNYGSSIYLVSNISII